MSPASEVVILDLVNGRAYTVGHRSVTIQVETLTHYVGHAYVVVHEHIVREQHFAATEYFGKLFGGFAACAFVTKHIDKIRCDVAVYAVALAHYSVVTEPSAAVAAVIVVAVIVAAVAAVAAVIAVTVVAVVVIAVVVVAVIVVAVITAAVIAVAVVVAVAAVIAVAVVVAAVIAVVVVVVIAVAVVVAAAIAVAVITAAIIVIAAVCGISVAGAASCTGFLCRNGVTAAAACSVRHVMAEGGGFFRISIAAGTYVGFYPFVRTGRLFGDGRRVGMFM